MTNEPRTFEVAIDGLPGAGMWLAGNDEHQPVRAIAVDVEADRLREIKVFVAPAGRRCEAGPHRFRVHRPRSRRFGAGSAAADFTRRRGRYSIGDASRRTSPSSSGIRGAGWRIARGAAPSSTG